MEQLTDHPFVNGVMTFDLKLTLKSKGISAKTPYKEQLFVDFI